MARFPAAERRNDSGRRGPLGVGFPVAPPLCRRRGDGRWSSGFSRLRRMEAGSRSRLKAELQRATTVRKRAGRPRSRRLTAHGHVADSRNASLPQPLRLATGGPSLRDAGGAEEVRPAPSGASGESPSEGLRLAAGWGAWRNFRRQSAGTTVAPKPQGHGSFRSPPLCRRRKVRCPAVCRGQGRSFIHGGREERCLGGPDFLNPFLNPPPAGLKPPGLLLSPGRGA
jgi:hypothetical protein